MGTQLHCKLMSQINTSQHWCQAGFCGSRLQVNSSVTTKKKAALGTHDKQKCMDAYDHEKVIK